MIINNSIGVSNNSCSSYSTESKMTALNSEKEDTKTTIQKDNYYSKSDEISEVILSHYKKVNNMNKSFSDPKKHLLDKYCVRSSKHFRSNMTEEERKIAYRNELRMLEYGNIPSISMGDYVLRGYGKVNDYDESVKENQGNRNAITLQLNQLFKDNNIIVPQDTSVRFTINPYDFTVLVEGIEDENLRNRMNEVLSSGDNLKNLFFHINNCSMNTDSSQITEDKLNKFRLFWEIKHNTGYDLRELRNENGKFYTKEGKDILDIYKNSSSIPLAYRGSAVSHYEQYLITYGRAGFNNSEDLLLSIEYKNGYLYDIGSGDVG